MAAVRTETVVRWHRDGFRALWRRRSRSRGGRHGSPREIRDLVREMSRASRLWGAPRIHGELPKLGIEGAQSTVTKYIIKRRGPPSHGHVERLIGSIRRESTDHMIVFGEAHLRRVMTAHAAYDNEARAHLSSGKDAPIGRSIKHLGHISARPMVGGLHHRCRRI